MYIIKYKIYLPPGVSVHFDVSYLTCYATDYSIFALTFSIELIIKAFQVKQIHINRNEKKCAITNESQLKRIETHFS